MNTICDPISTDRAYSGFLALPTELRCHIYDYILADGQAITISAGYITVFGNRIQDRARKTEIPGLPLDLAPIVRCHHDASLLSAVTPPEVPIDDGWMGEIGEEKLGYPAPLALLQICRLVNDELKDYMQKKKAIARAQDPEESAESQEDKEGLSLYVTYPYGILILKTLYPSLLKQARRVYVTGHYTSPKAIESEEYHGISDEELPNSIEDPDVPTSTRSFVRLAAPRVSATSSPRRLRLCGSPSRTQFSTLKYFFPPTTTATTAHASEALCYLVRTLLPPTTTALVKLEIRIVYPGEYKWVWSDENSPVEHIMRNICGGKIDMQVKRSNIGTGVRLVARPKTDGRMISTSWVQWKLGPGRTGAVGVDDLDEFLLEE